MTVTTLANYSASSAGGSMSKQGQEVARLEAETKAKVGKGV